jgi:hypothetical protein
MADYSAREMASEGLAKVMRPLGQRIVRWMERSWMEIGSVPAMRQTGQDSEPCLHSRRAKLWGKAQGLLCAMLRDSATALNLRAIWSAAPGRKTGSNSARRSAREMAPWLWVEASAEASALD